MALVVNPPCQVDCTKITKLAIYLHNFRTNATLSVASVSIAVD